MLEGLSQRLGAAVKSLSGQGRITERNVRDAMADVRRGLIEADVSLPVVEEFCASVTEEALGEKVLQSLRPGEQMVHVVHTKLVELMGPVESHIPFVDPGPTVVMVCGLQGTGKTTTCGKLAAWMKRNGKSVLVAAADLQRPAAVEQLRLTTEGVAEHARGDAKVGFHGEPERCAAYGEAVGEAVTVCMNAMKRARSERWDVLLIDTAGRLHIDEALMGELRGVQRAVNPHSILLVVDAMAGQDAVNAAATFHKQLEVDGVILTKLDSDTRGGAALSVKSVTGAPIRFIGTGEKYDDLEAFHPDRMAGRILGMGDVVSLVEKAQEEVDEEEAEALAKKMAEGRFTMDDFLKQIRSLRRMGSMKSLLGMLPGVGSMLKGMDVDEGALDSVENVAKSMTKAERADVSVMNKSRVRRVARGSGSGQQDVNRLLKQFDMVKKMSQQMAGGGMKGRMQMARQMAGGGMPGMGLPSRGSTKTSGVKSKFKKRKRR
ncbi:MAG: signal recognition particle protein [Phycisphaerales bacterium]|nr:signal recognition particle protein [Phycisphaerales bacterium]